MTIMDHTCFPDDVKESSPASLETKFGLKLSVELLPGDVSLAGSEVSDALGW